MIIENDRNFKRLCHYLNFLNKVVIKCTVVHGSVLQTQSSPCFTNPVHVQQIQSSLYFTIGTLRYEDGKARKGTAVDAGNFRGSRLVAKNKMLKMCIFAKDDDFKNSNFQNAILRSNDIL